MQENPCSPDSNTGLGEHHFLKKLHSFLSAFKIQGFISLKLVFVVLCLVFIVFFASVIFNPIPKFEVVRAAQHSSEAVLLDRNDVVIERLRLDYKHRTLDWVKIEQISPHMQHAMVAAEDKRFYSHLGVDLIAITSAFIDNLHRSRPRGASTITMQLANLISNRDAHGAMGTWMEKLRQMRDAFSIELYWDKHEILEAYLNLVPFRGELVGIDAASRGLLAKGPDSLNIEESALLASLVRAPSASRLNIAKRACATVKAMSAEAGDKRSKLNLSQLCEQSALLATGLPIYPYPLPGVDEAPHLARRLLKNPGEQIKVSLDASVQHFALETLRSQLAELRNQNVEDGAVVVLDNLSGEVLAYVGSSGDLSGSPEVDGVSALRQPGSTLKPFLYGLAIDQGWLNASSVLDDSPLALTTPSGLYIPQDYDHDFHGAVSVRTALGSSLNVPAVRTLTLVGVDPFLNTLRSLGLVSLTQDADHYGFGLALGGAETNLLQLTNAYRTLANGGCWSESRFIRWNAAKTQVDRALNAQSKCNQVLRPQAAFVISEILSDSAARTLTFGLSSPLSTHMWAAVKTGTSKAMRDNWAVGYTDQYTVGVWVGNFSGAPMWDVSGVTGAAPVWRNIVEHLHQNKPSIAPSVPKGVFTQQIEYRPQIESARSEWLVVREGREPPKHVVIKIASSLPTLVAPPDSAIIAPDPDIPQARQALLLQSNEVNQMCMELDSHRVAACGVKKVIIPLPSPGKHTLSLTDLKGQIIDLHRFEVRPINLHQH